MATYFEPAEAFRAKLQRLLATELPSNWCGMDSLERTAADEFVQRWRDVLRRYRLLAITWPEEYGGASLTKVEQIVFAEECARAGVPASTYPDVFGIKMIGNAILRWGSALQRAYFLPRILSGQHRWCQGLSEPDAGSDLAGLTTSAVRDGDVWRINGEKTWTALAHSSNWIFLLVRTDFEATRTRGLSLLLCPLNKPGIEVRRIKDDDRTI